jgi:flagellar protein FliS
MKRGFGTYHEINTMGKSQLDLILMIYRGAIGLLEQAKCDFQAGELTAGRAACEKARKCIVHLYTTLDMDKGQEIAARLGQLYAYMIEQLDLAMASKSLPILDAVAGMLATIKEGWENLKQGDGAPGGAVPGEGNDTAKSTFAGEGRITVSA